MAPKKILIVEDEVVVAMELQGLLSAMGHSVVGTAPSGEEAVEKAGQLKPDVILMDIRLAGEIDGIEAARIVGERFHIPVIYVTAHAGDEMLERAKQTFPLGYIVKPFSETELRVSIEIGLFRHEQETRLRESSEFFSMTLDVLGGAVIVTDENGIIQHMSSVAETLTGWAHGEAAGRHLAEVYVLRDEESGQIIRNPLSIMHMRSDFIPVSSKYTLISRNNLPVPVANTVMAVADSEGKMRAVIVAFQDSSQMVMPEQFWNSYAANLHLSALLLCSQGHHARAEACFKRALLIWERNLGSDHPKICRALEGLSEVYEKTGRIQEAKQLQGKAAAIRAGVPFSSS